MINITQRVMMETKSSHRATEEIVGIIESVIEELPSRFETKDIIKLLPGYLRGRLDIKTRVGEGLNYFPGRISADGGIVSRVVYKKSKNF